ncbi:Gfo/Idh/MocA family oxidoreductase [Notoacmeibacter sp. MSK16QG-6]|nr:Gfo/Idh/MocA family oxidoreductase [Notoacmeibacter sp. MSK16QG-6]
MQKRIALFGGGAIGRTHAAAIERAANAVLHAIVDPDPAAGQLAERHGCRHVCRTEDLDVTAVDGAIIAAPNALHVPLGARMLERGIPLLIEKPLAHSCEEAEIIAAQSEKAGVPVLVGHQRRHNPIIEAARTAIDEMLIGDLVTGSISCTLLKPDSYFDLKWRTEPQSGGPILINLIHEIDLIRFLFGEVESVVAQVSPSRRGHLVEDGAIIGLRMAGGGLISIIVTDAGVGPWAWDLTAGENPERFPSINAASHIFAGTEGGLSLPDLSLWTHDGARQWTTSMSARALPHASADPYIRQIEHFLDVIDNKTPPIATARDGVMNLLVLQAIQQSAQSQRTVTLRGGSAT